MINIDDVIIENVKSLWESSEYATIHFRKQM
jgi:hypothetical protein